MSRAARKSNLLRSGVIGFVAGIATLGVVAHGSPAHALVASALGQGSPEARTVALPASHGKHRTAQAQDPWLVPQQQPQAPSAQPQYQQPQQQPVQPAPSQTPQSQAS